MKYLYVFFFTCTFLFFSSLNVFAVYYQVEKYCGNDFVGKKVDVTVGLLSNENNSLDISTNIGERSQILLKASYPLDIVVKVIVNSDGNALAVIRAESSLSSFWPDTCVLAVNDTLLDPQTVSFILGALVVLSFALAFSTRIL